MIAATSGKGRVILACWTATFWAVTANSVVQRRKVKQRRAREDRDKEAAGGGGLGSSGGRGDGDSAGGAPATQKTAAEGGPSGPSGPSDSSSNNNNNNNNKVRIDPVVKQTVLTRAPWWRSAVVLRALLLSGTIVLRLWVQIKVSRQIGLLGSLLSQRRWRALAEAQMRYAIWTVPASFLNSAVDACSSFLAMAVQTQLMKHIHAGYGCDGVLAKVSQSVPDPDQRATADAEKLATEVAVMYQSVFKPVSETVIISATLANMMGLRPLLMCYTYFALAGTWSRSVTPSLTTLATKVQLEDGQFRASHSRLKEYAEEVQFAGGEGVEASLLSKHFHKLSSSKVTFLFQQFASSSLDGYVVRYMGILTALAMMTPALAKRGRDERIKDPTEFFLTCLHLLVNLMGAFKDVALAFRTLGSVRALSERITGLLKLTSVDGARDPVAQVGDASAVVTLQTEDAVRFENVKIVTPPAQTGKDGADAGRVLFDNLNLELRQGESVFLHGTNGSGKTSIMRVLAGIWRPSAGILAMPARDRCMFLTQRPYLAQGLTIRQQLLYPNVDDKSISDQVLVAALQFVDLASSQDRTLSLDVVWNYDGLSAGEQQRLACARLLVRKPMFAFVDECTSSCTEDFEVAFLSYCILDLGITMVTISHRAAGKHLHPRVVHVSPGSVANVH